MQCTATSKRTGQRCNGKAVTGRTTCRMHGGTAPIGAAHPNTKHGRRSKHLPTRLRAAYDQAKDDPELYHLDDELALVDARITELAAQLDIGSGGSLWFDLSEAWAEFERTRKLPDDIRGPRMADALAEVGSLVNRGRSDHVTWLELGKQIDRKARLLDKRAKIAGAYTAEQVLLMLGTIAQSIARNVDDHHARARIGREVEAAIDIESWRLLPAEP